MALSYPKVKFKLINDEKELLNTDGSGNLLKVIKAIYGLDVTKKMITVQGSNDDYDIEGYISMPEVSRSSRNYMTTLVNGRVVRNTSLNKTINDSYSNYKDNLYFVVKEKESDMKFEVIGVTEDDVTEIDIKIKDFENDSLSRLHINQIFSADIMRIDKTKPIYDLEDDFEEVRNEIFEKIFSKPIDNSKELCYSLSEENN